MTTFLIMWYIYGVNSGSPEHAITMQTAWFIESLMTQVLFPSLSSYHHIFINEEVITLALCIEVSRQIPIIGICRLI